jgi:hypothetical protein
MRLSGSSENQRFTKLIHEPSHDVAHFLNPLRIRRQLERVGTVRLQSEGMPNPADGHAAESAGFG